MPMHVSQRAVAFAEAKSSDQNLMRSYLTCYRIGPGWVDPLANHVAETVKEISWQLTCPISRPCHPPYLGQPKLLDGA